MIDMPRGLLDTSALIDLPLLTSDMLPTELSISALTIAELAAGPHATSDSAERAARQQRLQWAEATFDPIPFDVRAARAFGRVYAAVRATGRTSRRRVVDLQIASVAEVHHLPLLTRNPQDFAGLNEVIHVISV